MDNMTNKTIEENLKNLTKLCATYLTKVYEVKQKEEKLNARERAVNAKGYELDARVKELDKLAADISVVERDLIKRENDVLNNKAPALTARESELTKRESELRIRMNAIEVDTNYQRDLLNGKIKAAKRELAEQQKANERKLAEQHQALNEMLNTVNQSIKTYKELTAKYPLTNTGFVDSGIANAADSNVAAVETKIKTTEPKIYEIMREIGMLKV